jgi:hypothetical protein
MVAINRVFTGVLSAGRSRTVRIAITVLTIALFVFAAAAPNATVGIGK